MAIDMDNELVRAVARPQPQLRHQYEPWGSAKELFAYRGAEVLISGPAGTGKSRACLEKMHFMMMATPGSRGLLVRKTASSLTSTALVTYAEYVAKEALESGEVKFYGGSTREAAQYAYGNGSSITIGGLDKVSRIMSSEYDVIYVQEATEISEDDWESLTTRLRNGKISFQQIMADCNPGPPHHWLKRRCDDGRTLMLHASWQDNPRLFDRKRKRWTPEGGKYIKLLEGLTGVRRLRLAKGQWAAAEGLVYEGYDPAIHLHKAIMYPPHDWPRYWSVDFGFTNPFVWQDWTADPDGRLILVQEIYRTQTLVEDHCEVIKKMTRDHGRAAVPEFVVCDHDAEDRATLERHLGLSTVPAIKNVSEGIQAVAHRLKLRADGKPGLYLCEDNDRIRRDRALQDAALPTSTRDEITEYTWLDTQGRENPKDAPVKKNDHGMDAMRYLVAQIDLKKTPRARWINMGIQTRSDRW